MNVFTYGSLMFPEVWRRVAGQDHCAAPATLAAHAAWKVRGQSYPGLTEAPDEATKGIVYFEVEPEAAGRLDTFEGSFYTRVPVSVRLSDGRMIPAQVYLVNKAFRNSLSDERWDAEEFRIRHLASFLGPQRAG